jgi:hypothetical protein
VKRHVVVYGLMKVLERTLFNRPLTTRRAREGQRNGDGEA